MRDLFTTGCLVAAVLIMACHPSVPPVTPNPVPPTPPIVTVPNAGERGRLHVEGTRFVREDGSTYQWRGFSDFKLLKKLCDGDNITALLDQRIAYGANLVRVLGMAHNLFELSPTFNPAQYDECFHLLAGTLAERGLRMEFVVFADAQNVMPDMAAQRAHLAHIVDLARQHWNVVLEGCNECSKNGVDPRWFPEPDDVLMSRGSGQSDEPPPLPLMAFTGFHPRRDWKWPVTVPQTLFELRQGFGTYVGIGWNSAIVIDEPIGAADADVAGKRSANPDLFYRAAVDYALWSAGATFHSDVGLQSDFLTPKQGECAAAFFHGLSQGVH